MGAPFTDKCGEACEIFDVVPAATPEEGAAEVFWPRGVPLTDDMRGEACGTFVADTAPTLEGEEAAAGSFWPLGVPDGRAPFVEILRGTA